MKIIDKIEILKENSLDLFEIFQVIKLDLQIIQFL